MATHGSKRQPVSPRVKIAIAASVSEATSGGRPEPSRSSTPARAGAAGSLARTRAASAFASKGDAANFAGSDKPEGPSASVSARPLAGETSAANKSFQKPRFKPG